MENIPKTTMQYVSTADIKQKNCFSQAQHSSSPSFIWIGTDHKSGCLRILYHHSVTAELSSASVPVPQIKNEKTKIVSVLTASKKLNKPQRNSRENNNLATCYKHQCNQAKPQENHGNQPRTNYLGKNSIDDIITIVKGKSKTKFP